MHILIVVEIVPEIMIDCDMSFETDLWGVQNTLILITNNTAAIKVLLSNTLLVPNHREGINDDGKDESKEYLVDQHNIGILKNLEKVHNSNLPSTLLEQIPHETSYTLIGGHKHKSEALR